MRAMTYAFLLMLAACATAVPAASPETAEYAPSLRVDLTQMQRMPGGLYIRDLRAGAGMTAQPGRRLSVHYVGWLPDGTQFDGVAAPSAPVTFVLGRGEVIRGWDAGLAGMRTGGQRMIVVPPALGYGARRSGAVPPNSVLVFVVDLIDAQ